MRNLENGKGSIIASARISAPGLSGRPKDHEKPPQPGTFVTLHGSWDRWGSTGRSRPTKLYLDSRPPLPRKPKPELQKGETQWSTSTIPLANHRTDSRKVELQLQPARSFQKEPQKSKRKLPTSAARRWTISTNPGKAPRAPWTKQQRN